MVVAVVAAGFAVYTGFGLVLPSVYAACLTALVFLALSLGLMAMLKDDEDNADALDHRADADPQRWAGLAGQVLAAFAAGALAGMQERRRR
jgi:hypothetical protein